MRLKQFVVLLYCRCLDRFMARSVFVILQPNLPLFLYTICTLFILESNLFGALSRTEIREQLNECRLVSSIVQFSALSISLSCTLSTRAELVYAILKPQAYRSHYLRLDFH